MMTLNKMELKGITKELLTIGAYVALTFGAAFLIMR
jgi:hypothetical protein